MARKEGKSVGPAGESDRSIWTGWRSEREHEYDLKTAARKIAGCHAAAVKLRHAPRDGEAQAKLGEMRCTKRFGQPTQLLRVRAEAVVGDAPLYVRVSNERQAHPYLALSGLKGVKQQKMAYLSQPLAVRVDR
jgi:hypothetical protein